MVNLDQEQSCAAPTPGSLAVSTFSLAGGNTVHASSEKNEKQNSLRSWSQDSATVPHKSELSRLAHESDTKVDRHTAQVYRNQDNTDGVGL